MVIVIVGLFLAIVDFAHIVSMHAAAVTASRDAARYGSVSGEAPPPAPSGTPQYIYCQGIRDAARNATRGLITLPDGKIAIQYDDGPSTTANRTCGSVTTAQIDRFDRVVVTVDITYAPVSPLRVFGDATVQTTSRRSILKASGP